MNYQFTNQHRSFQFEYWLSNGQHGFYSALAYNAREAEERALSQLIETFGYREIAIKPV